MTKSIDQKRENEKAVVSLMIRLYCKKRHGTKTGLCPECTSLAEYARELFFASIKSPKLQAKMENIASPFWRMLQATS